MDENGPCGFCTEIFYKDHYNEYLEIWNIVFIEFIKNNGKIKMLKYKFLDTGGGLERLAFIKQKVNDIFLIDNKKELSESILKKYGLNEFNEKTRSIIDYFVTTKNIISAGITPNNKKHGYVLRKILRKIFDLCAVIHIYLDEIIDKNTDKLNSIKKFLLVSHAAGTSEKAVKVSKCNCCQ